MKLNPYQAAAARVYGGGDFAYLADEGVSARDLANINVGDTLFRFVLIELSDSEGCEDMETAVRRIEIAIRDLSEVLNALRGLAFDAIKEA